MADQQAQSRQDMATIQNTNKMLTQELVQLRDLATQLHNKVYGLDSSCLLYSKLHELLVVVIRACRYITVPLTCTDCYDLESLCHGT